MVEHQKWNLNHLNIHETSANLAIQSSWLQVLSNTRLPPCPLPCFHHSPTNWRGKLDLATSRKRLSQHVQDMDIPGVSAASSGCSWWQVDLVGGFNHLKNISQLGWLFQIYGKIKFMFQSPPTRIDTHYLFLGDYHPPIFGQGFPATLRCCCVGGLRFGFRLGRDLYGNIWRISQPKSGVFCGY